MYTATYNSSEPFTKPSIKCGALSYLISFARQLLASASGSVEVRDAHGTLAAMIYTDGEEIKEWAA